MRNREGVALKEIVVIMLTLLVSLSLSDCQSQSPIEIMNVMTGRMIGTLWVKSDEFLHAEVMSVNVTAQNSAADEESTTIYATAYDDVNIPFGSATVNISLSAGEAKSVLLPIYIPTWALSGSACQVIVLIPSSNETSHMFSLLPQTAGHDVAVTDLKPYKAIFGKGYVGNVSVAIANPGGYAETFNVTVFANTTVISVIENVNLAAGDSTNRTVLWNTTSFSYGNYTLQAIADAVPGEVDTANNVFMYNISVHVGVPGDVSSTVPGSYDGRVDLKDIAYLVDKFNTWNGKAGWDPNADVNCDGICNMRDTAIAVANFNQHE